MVPPGCRPPDHRAGTPATPSRAAAFKTRLAKRADRPELPGPRAATRSGASIARTARTAVLKVASTTVESRIPRARTTIDCEKARPPRAPPPTRTPRASTSTSTRAVPARPELRIAQPHSHDRARDGQRQSTESLCHTNAPRPTGRNPTGPAPEAGHDHLPNSPTRPPNAPFISWRGMPARRSRADIACPASLLQRPLGGGVNVAVTRPSTRGMSRRSSDWSLDRPKG